MTLKPRKVRPFFGRHPWVLASAIARVEGSPIDGQVVDLVSDRGQWIARGFFNSQSRIQTRLYSWNEGEALDRACWQRRLETAIGLRESLGYADTQGAARLVFSEADGLGGLVVDRFADHLVVQPTALAMAERLPEWIELLRALVPVRAIIVKADREMNRAEGMHVEPGTVFGPTPAGPVFIHEHGIRYGVDLLGGQKTGFFLDQRENRRAAAAHLAGRRVLDLFCHTGGFGLAAAMLGQAKEVIGVDSSQPAITLARANVALNGVANVHFEIDDCFRRAETLLSGGEVFGGIVLDPPKFARTRQAVPDALRAYHHLNRLAVGLLEPGATLVTCSCSGHVTREDFAHMLADVAQRTGRDIQFLEQRGASPDHPVAATCLETDYLKCFICRVV